MHDSMQYDPIQGQGQGHEPLKFGNSAIFKGYLLHIYNGADMTSLDRLFHRFLNYGTIPTAYRGWILYFYLRFLSCDFEVGIK